MLVIAGQVVASTLALVNHVAVEVILIAVMLSLGYAMLVVQ